MNQIEIFNSPEFGSIRTLEQNGKVLFCVTDVATALGYTNPRKAVRDHTRGGTKCSIRLFFLSFHCHFLFCRLSFL